MCNHLDECIDMGIPVFAIPMVCSNKNAYVPDKLNCGCSRQNWAWDFEETKLRLGFRQWIKKYEVIKFTIGDVEDDKEET